VRVLLVGVGVVVKGGHTICSESEDKNRVEELYYPEARPEDLAAGFHVFRVLALSAIKELRASIVHVDSFVHVLQGKINQDKCKTSRRCSLQQRQAKTENHLN
jgi:hypothetical protein